MITNNFMSLLKDQKVIIPQIQRDYAQGRISQEISRIRERFLDSLCTVLLDSYIGESLKLDFIYGYTTKDETNKGKIHLIFKPLDGQQRLTTLFLLYWYVAITEKISDNEIRILANFSYATRAKSRSFCEKLVNFRPQTDTKKSMKEQIENQPWFFLSWASDPTISGMLVMLNSIEKKYMDYHLHDVWPRLTGEKPAIVFYLLNMDDLGLPEDLYIKMNSRGKPLTQFEHFKAQFSRIIPSELSAEFNAKIDKEWSDLFWDIHKTDRDEKDNLALRVDNSFLNFYNYITDHIIATKGLNVENAYWLKVAETVYSFKEHVQFLFKCLDTFVIQQKNHKTYFNDLFYLSKIDFSIKKTKLFFNNSQIDIFNKCAKVYHQGEGRNPFSIGEQLLLYACMINLQESLERFPENLRMLRNLIAASEDQLRKEFLGVLYKDVDDIIHNRFKSDQSKFSTHQIKEESSKKQFLSKNIDMKELIYKLEDHHLLRGSICILGIDEITADIADCFHTTFKEPSCDYYSISLDLLSIGDYSQGYGNENRRRLGNGNPSTWRELFSLSESRTGFYQTQKVLLEYFKNKKANITTKSNNQGTLNHTILDWRYYYRKYENFRKWKNQPTDGFYDWKDYKNKPFDFIMMFKYQYNGRHWNPFLLEISSRNKNCTLEDYGHKLNVNFELILFFVSMNNDSFKFEVEKEDSESNNYLTQCIEQGLLSNEGNLHIPQINSCEDKVDRIELFLETLSKIEELISRRNAHD